MNKMEFVGRWFSQEQSDAVADLLRDTDKQRGVELDSLALLGHRLEYERPEVGGAV